MMLAQLYSLFNPILYCYRDRRFRDAFLQMLKMKKPAASAQRKNRRIGSAQTLENLQSPYVVPRSRSKTLANLASNDVGTADGQVRRERCMSVPTPSTNETTVNVHQPKITITPAPGIQVESGATVR